jgi:hypothetical protein
MHPNDSPLYYLANFQFVLAFIATRYDDLLASSEQAFIQQFQALPRDAQALLVRLIMRSRDVFIENALNYVEISALRPALQALHTVGFIEQNTKIGLEDVFCLCKKADILKAFTAAGLSTKQSKAEMHEMLSHRHPESKTLEDWLKLDGVCAVRLLVRPIVDTFRLLFFGNLYQDWSEFVITDLGHLRYESISIPDTSRGFTNRTDLDICLQLHELRICLEAGEPVHELFQRLPSDTSSLSPAVASRVAKFVFQLGQAAERGKDWQLAKTIYQACGYKGARHRLLRVHEQLSDWPAAFALAQDILLAPSGEDELQATRRALPRLARKLKQPVPITPELIQTATDSLNLNEAPTVCVEVSVAQAISRDNLQVHYVENTLFSSLFGLVFWEAIFAPSPGAFFHPFQSGPADLFHPDFATRRESELAAGFERLTSDNLAEQLITRWQTKFGLQNPFVFWQQLDELLIQRAVSCISRESLRIIFTRMLADLKNHRSGFPDLIVFDTLEQRYELIEVKAPNDRVQDNQARWMDYFLRHDIPCRVIHVSWPT